MLHVQIYSFSRYSAEKLHHLNLDHLVSSSLLLLNFFIPVQWNKTSTDLQMIFFLKIQKASFIPAIFSPPNIIPKPFQLKTGLWYYILLCVSADGKCVCMYLRYVCTCVCVCVNSMSFTPNIVNIHRTILHVLALRFGKRWGGDFWFTSLEHHERGRRGGEDGRGGLARRRGGGGGGEGGGLGVCSVLLSRQEGSSSPCPPLQPVSAS